MTSEFLVSRPFCGKRCLARYKGKWSRVEVRWHCSLQHRLCTGLTKGIKSKWTKRAQRREIIWNCQNISQFIYSFKYHLKVILLILFTAVIIYLKNKRFLSWDHQPSRQQSAGHPVRWCGCAGLCRGVWAERDPTAVPPWPHGHPATGQLLCPRAVHRMLCYVVSVLIQSYRFFEKMTPNNLCLGREVLSGRPCCQCRILDSRCCPVASRESAQHHRL